MPPVPNEIRSRRAIAAALSAIDGAARGRPLAHALTQALARAGKMGPRERRAAASAARGVLRELRRIDLALESGLCAAGLSVRALLPEDRSLARYLALRISVEEEPAPEVLKELARPGPPRSRALDGAALARIAAALPLARELPRPADPISALALRHSVPDFLASRLSLELGAERADRVLEALNRPARLDLRANLLRTTREALAERLAARGVATAPCALSPEGLVAADRSRLFGGGPHADGQFEAQDEGSQLIALTALALPGELAVDYCAGSGGKALALAAHVGRSGRVVACDANLRRLSELPARARHAGAGRIIEVAAALPGSLEARADAVLVDAPCSGIGSLRREVDLRWRLAENDLDRFPERQLAILAEASRLVRPGGRLVYATCSPLRAEGEAVVERFLKGAPAFAPGDLRRGLPACAHPALESDWALRTWPERDGGGAFFAALLVRRLGGLG